MKNKIKLADLDSITDKDVNKIYNVMDSMQDICTTNNEKSILLASLTEAIIWSKNVQ